MEEASNAVRVVLSSSSFRSALSVSPGGGVFLSFHLCSPPLDRVTAATARPAGCVVRAYFLRHMIYRPGRVIISGCADRPTRCDWTYGREEIPHSFGEIARNLHFLDIVRLYMYVLELPAGPEFEERRGDRRRL